MSTSYINEMAVQANTGFRNLFASVDRITFTDFPDYPNVGDAAIALATVTFLGAANIEITGIYSLSTLPQSILDSTDPIYINGGGNIGLYRQSDQHRYRIAEHLRPGTRIIQGPQSVHFASEAGRHAFTERFGNRRDVTIAARDERSRRALEDLNISAEIMLMPDAVHVLGALRSPQPVQKTLFLTRRDIESAESRQVKKAVNGVDWPIGELFTTGSIPRWLSEPFPALSRRLTPSKRGWLNLAHKRLTKGINLLSRGEIIITDRLHAMLLGLQMGRSVVAIDNSNRKLTKYAETWFNASSPDVQFASSFVEAQRIVG